MFISSPFDPVQDVVAEAKKERAQLDHLLKISTPSESVLVLLTALVIILFGAWLLFGEVARNLAITGVLLPSGEQEQMTVGSLQAVIWLQADIADELKAGTPVTIEVNLSEGTPRRVRGEIDTLAPVALPSWYAPITPKAPVTMRRIEVALKDSLGREFLGAQECRILANLGWQPPVALFGLGRS